MTSAGTDSSISVYMREIAKTKLLTPEEEIELAARIAKGDDRARARMIESNLRLVVKIAKDYANYGVPLVDLISEGNIGLIRAVEKFDPNKGGKLSTYAAWWIKQSIKRALANQGKTVRLPIHLVDKLARVRRISALMAEDLGREPTDSELSEELGIPREKLALLLQASKQNRSMDETTHDDSIVSFGEVIADDRAIDPLEALSQKNGLDELDLVLDTLNERETEIIGARFGLNGKRILTLEEIGRDFGVSRERIRQIQNVALNKMQKALTKKNAIPPPKLRKSAT
ncbi:MAG: RNA polymerase sigma factor RpoD/SigA [Akkermansiaceae bacterium]|nr:RNA polymerase sigma factor RpoD/SigA [Akkermansiaceae bacterium]